MEVSSQLTTRNTLHVKQSMRDLPQLIVSDGTVEALKWLALILMTGDHLNKYLFNGTLPGLFEAGRLALPLFVCVLAYNLARPHAFECGVYKRVMIRLAVFGGLATPLFIALGGSWFRGFWPLNVMFTLLVFTATACLVEQGKFWSAGLVFLFGGSLGEFLWPAILFGLAIWSYCRQPSVRAAGIALIACASFWFINHNMWALAALPIILVATQVDFRVPRLRLFFYGYYPLHLAFLLLIRIPMTKAGYLFFPPGF